MRKTGKGPGALGGALKGAGAAPGTRKVAGNSRVQRNQSRPGNVNRRQTPPPPHHGGHHEPPRHRGGRRSGSCASSLAAIIILLAIVFVVYFGDEIKAKLFQNEDVVTSTEAELEFRNPDLLEDHYKKHGIDMGFSSAQSYENAAAAVVENKDSLHKKEAEDGDDVYYLERTNELVIVAKDGYIRTYFCPDDGIDYYNRQ